MTFELEFLPKALKEWRALDSSVRIALKKVLKRRLQEPCVPSAKLSGMNDCYKIKHRASGYRLVYQVDEGTIVVLVLAVGKRERNRVYQVAAKRGLKEGD